MTERVMIDANGRKYITNEPFKPDYNTEAVLVEEMQRMAKRIDSVNPPSTWNKQPLQEVLC